jgi:hypothetical protein
VCSSFVCAESRPFVPACASSIASRAGAVKVDRYAGLTPCSVAAKPRLSRQRGAQEADALANGDTAFQHDGAELIDDAGTLADQPLTHPVQRLQVELVPSRNSSWDN